MIGQLAATAVILLTLANLYFAWDGVLIYLHDPGRSPLLLALLSVKIAILVFGAYFAALSVAFLLNPVPVSAGSLLFAALLIGLELVPSFIHVQMRRIERSRE